MKKLSAFICSILVAFLIISIYFACKTKSEIAEINEMVNYMTRAIVDGSIKVVEEPNGECELVFPGGKAEALPSYKNESGSLVLRRIK
ncbi:hypothetical protein GF382_00520 [Candidatus Falkowbacteria bacterium]|nr:hypothetical protein [Candidatus Falkowbacteria bacterium]